MANGEIERLLEAANSASDGDTSINLAKRQFADDQTAAALFQDTRNRLVLIEVS